VTALDVLCLVLAGLVLAVLVAFVLRQAYRRANPKPRPPGSLTSVGQGRPG
jgi:hypothetical protein